MQNKLIKMKKAGFVALGVAASGSAFAVDDQQITDALAAGETSYGLVVAGLVTIAAVAAGLGYILAGMKKS